MMHLKADNLMEYKEKLFEDKFSRKLGEIVKGNVPRVRTFAILTPENPQSSSLLPEENMKRRQKFEKENGDESRRRGFRRLDGTYFGKENSYFIPNVAYSETMEMGKEYNQTSVIWGHIKTDENGETYADISEIYCTDQYDEETKRLKHKIGDLAGHTTVFIEVPPEQHNLYSKAYGRKLSLPFPEYPENKHLKDVKWYDKNKGILINPAGEKFDKYGHKIDETKISKEQMEEINFLMSKILRENSTAKYRWQCRSKIDGIINESIVN